MDPRIADVPLSRAHPSSLSCTSSKKSGDGCGGSRASSEGPDGSTAAFGGDMALNTLGRALHPGQSTRKPTLVKSSQELTVRASP
jgi:hypothetical protein